MVVRVNRDQVADFTARIAPLIREEDFVDLVRRDDALLVVTFTDDPDGFAENARNAGFDVDRPDRAVEVPPLGADDPLLGPLIPVLIDRGVPIGALSFDRIDLGFSDVVFDDDVQATAATPERLPCPTAEDEGPIATGTGQRATDPLDPNTDLTDEESSVAARARANAFDQVREFLAANPIECEGGCEPTVRLLLGKPRFEPLRFPVPLVLVLLGRVSWEIYVECTELGSLGFEFVDAPVKPRKRPLKCGDQYAVGGTGKGMAEELTARDPNKFDPKSPRVTGAPRDVRRRVLRQARDAAVEQMYEQITKAIESRPACPAVSCPDPRIVVRFGFPKGIFRFELTDEYEVFRAIGTAFVEWQIEITCAKDG